MPTIHCASCGQPSAAHEVVQYGSLEDGYRELCNRCFNETVAVRLGLDDFEHIHFDPVRMTDAQGSAHEFQFVTRLFGPGVAIEALEFRDGEPSGYRFQVIGDPDDDRLELLGRLIAKMRRALALVHLDDTELGPQVNDRLVVRGVVDGDPDADERVPMVVIDGREFTWNEFGRMAAAFEGWQFRLEFRDLSDEV